MIAVVGPNGPNGPNGLMVCTNSASKKFLYSLILFWGEIEIVLACATRDVLCCSGCFIKWFEWTCSSFMPSKLEPSCGVRLDWFG